MKSNQEIAASVFEKSRVVLQERAVRRRRITAAASTLGIAAVITMTALLGKGAFKNGDIPNSDPPSMPTAADIPSGNTDTDFDSTFTNTPRTASESASSESGSSRADRESSQSTPASSEPSSRQGSANRSTASASGSRVNTGTSAGTSRGGDVSADDSSKNTSSRAAGSRITSSKPASSKNTRSNNSSKNTSSKNNSSKLTSSGTLSSVPTSSRQTGSAPASSRTMSSEGKDDAPTPSRHDEVSNQEPSTETMTDIDYPWPDAPDAPTEPSDGPEDTDSPADTDVDTAEQLFPVYRDEEYYNSAKELVSGADLVVSAYLEEIYFEKMTPDMRSLRSYIELPADDSFADIVTVYRLRVERTLGGIYQAGKGAYIEVYVYGGHPNYYYLPEELSVSGAASVPYVRELYTPPVGSTSAYVLDFDYNASAWTLHSYGQGVGQDIIGIGFSSERIAAACE